MGFGCLVRDSSEQVADAIYGCLPSSFNSTMAEALSVSEDLSWLKDLHFQNIVVESDAQLVIDALKSDSPDASSLRLILEDCSLFATEILSYTFVFVRRSAIERLMS